MRVVYACVCVIGLLLASVTPASAQGQCGTAVPFASPTTTSVTASADHAAVDPFDGTPKVAKYLVRVFLCSNDNAVKTYDLGKPAPDAANTLSAPVVKADFAAGVKYYLKWSAVSPSGLEGVSASSVPFGWKAPETAPAAPTAVTIKP